MIYEATCTLSSHAVYWAQGTDGRVVGVAASKVPTLSGPRRRRTDRDDRDEELYRHHFPRLAAFARSRGAEDPESLASAVLHDTIRRFSRPSHLREPISEAYLYRSVRNRLIDEFRRRRVNTVPLPTADDRPAPGPEPPSQR